MSQLMDVSSAVAAAAAGGAAGGRKRGRDSAGGGGKRRKARASRALTVLRPGINAVLPDNYRTKLRYSTYYQLYSASGLAIHKVFNANSLFDPDFTGSGHQPRGFDQLAALYGRYRVNSITVKVSIANLTNAGLLLAQIWCDNDSSDPGSTVRYEMNDQAMKASPVGGAGGDVTVLKKTWQLWKVAASSKRKYEDDDRYSAQVTTDPAEGLFVHLVTDSPQNTVHSAEGLIELVYDCTFYDAKTITSS